jgi:hypothetical protein
MIIPAEICKEYNLIVPAEIHKEHKKLISPATIYQDRTRILRDFLYRIKPILEYDLDLSDVADRIVLEFVYSSNEYEMDIEYPSDFNMKDTFRIYINMYSIDNKYSMLSVEEYLIKILPSFIKIMRSIYQFTNIFGYGWTCCEYVDGYDIIEDDEYNADIESYTNQIINKLYLDGIIYRLIHCVIINSVYNNIPEFDLIHWIYYVSNNSYYIQSILDEMNIDTMISYQNWYLEDQNDVYYIIDYNLNRDTCVIKFNCNIKINYDLESIISYTKSLFVSSIIDIASEIIYDEGISKDDSFVCVALLQSIDSFIVSFTRELYILFDRYITDRR